MLIIEILFIIMLSVVMLNVMAPRFGSFIKSYFLERGVQHAAICIGTMQQAALVACYISKCLLFIELYFTCCPCCPK